MTQENVMSGEATVSPEKKPKKHNRQYTLRESLLGYLFASPWIIGFIALMAFPLFYSLYLSFTNARTSSLFVNFVGWNNYRAILKDSAFWNSLLHTLWFVCLSVPLNLLFSLGIALLLNAKIPGKKFYRVLYYLPTGNDRCRRVFVEADAFFFGRGEHDAFVVSYFGPRLVQRL